jgi:hypothetical protein
MVAFVAIFKSNFMVEARGTVGGVITNFDKGAKEGKIVPGGCE